MPWSTTFRFGRFSKTCDIECNSGLFEPQASAATDWQNFCIKLRSSDFNRFAIDAVLLNMHWTSSNGSINSFANLQPRSKNTVRCAHVQFSTIIHSLIWVLDPRLYIQYFSQFCFMITYHHNISNFSLTDGLSKPNGFEIFLQKVIQTLCQMPN